MTNEEILNEVQKNPQKEGYGEREVQQTGIGFGFGIISLGIIYLILALFDGIVLKKFDFGKTALLTGFLASSNLYEGIKINKKISVVLGILCSIFTIVCIVMYLRGIIA